MHVIQHYIIGRLAAAAIGFLLAAPFQSISASADGVADVRWTRIPAGTFDMGCVPRDTDCSGDERPRHQVTLTTPFELMTTEVTVGMFQAYAGAEGRPMPQQPSWNRDSRHELPENHE